MSTLDTGLTFIRTASRRVSRASEWLGQWFKELMPKGLYARALLIIIVPMVILQSVVAFVFMERHWNTVTRRLSAAVVQDISALIDVYRSYPQDKDRTQIKRIGQQRLGLVVDFLPVNDMPAPGPKPFFSLLDHHSLPLVIMVSWGIAFFEYWLAVPANRWGSAVYSAAQLKTMQEVITLVVFAGFSVLYLKEPLGWNHAIGFAFIAAGAFFIFHKW